MLTIYERANLKLIRQPPLLIYFSVPEMTEECGFMVGNLEGSMYIVDFDQSTLEVINATPVSDDRRKQPILLLYEFTAIVMKLLHFRDVFLIML